MNNPSGVVGLVLAGGRSSRFNAGRADGIAKALVPLRGEPLVSHVVRRLGPQVSRLLINVNEDGERYRRFGEVVADSLPKGYPRYPGPLAGLVSGMAWLVDKGIQFEWVALAPCDGPFLPTELVGRLRHAAEAAGAEVACPAYLGEVQPTFSLWHRRCLDVLRTELLTLGFGGFKALIDRLPSARVDWPDEGFDPFFNINTPDDLARAEGLLAGGLRA
ncbi:MAG: molybdenum cofactor guanylyltransferase MobA [Porticoccaceae bacterium]|jgi:molybdopterin-guanine dinucleotide biosynthesis protein A|nr:molybdenum cofactor guanylyltransferase MobA [Porticoccaceae bacterium]